MLIKKVYKKKLKKKKKKRKKKERKRTVVFVPARFIFSDSSSRTQLISCSHTLSYPHKLIFLR